MVFIFCEDNFYAFVLKFKSACIMYLDQPFNIVNAPHKNSVFCFITLKKKISENLNYKIIFFTLTIFRFIVWPSEKRQDIRISTFLTRIFTTLYFLSPFIQREPENSGIFKNLLRIFVRFCTCNNWQLCMRSPVFWFSAFKLKILEK